MRKKIYAIIPLLVFVVWGIIIYAPAFHADFHLDDIYRIVDNPLLKNIKNIPQIWKMNPLRFLPNVSLALNYFYGGLNTFGYHLVNIIIHLMVTFLVYWFAKIIFSQIRKQSGPSKIFGEAFTLLAGFIFLSHPIQTSAVTYVVQRSTLLAAFFYLLSIIFYMRYRIHQKNHYYLISILSGFLAIFSKPFVVSLPLSVFLCEYFFFDSDDNGSSFQEKIIKILPYFLIVIHIPLLKLLSETRIWEWGYVWGLTKETSVVSRSEYLLTQIHVLRTYIRLLFFPVAQNLDYDYPRVVSLFNLSTVVSLAFLLSIFIWATKISQKYKIISFSILWFFLTVASESSFFPIADVIFEHRLYLPMVGGSLFFAAIIFQIMRDPRKTLGVGMIVVLTFSWTTFQRNALWRDQITLLKDVIKKSPLKARPHNNLAKAYGDQGLVPQAIVSGQKAIQIDPQYVRAHSNLCNLYRRAGQDTQAIRHCQRAIAIQPAYPVAHLNLGNVYRQMGKTQEAIRFYKKAIVLDKNYFAAHNNLGGIYYDLGKYREAIAHYQKAQTLDPSSAGLHSNLALAYHKIGQNDKALVLCQKAIQKNPALARSHYNLGIIYYRLKHTEASRRAFEKTVELDPAYAKAYVHLAVMAFNTQKYDRTIHYIDKALSLDHPVPVEFLKLIEPYRSLKSDK